MYKVCPLPTNLNFWAINVDVKFILMTPLPTPIYTDTFVLWTAIKNNEIQKNYIKHSATRNEISFISFYPNSKVRGKISFYLFSCLFPDNFEIDNL